MHCFIWFRNQNVHISCGYATMNRYPIKSHRLFLQALVVKERMWLSTRWYQRTFHQFFTDNNISLTTLLDNMECFKLFRGISQNYIIYNQVLMHKLITQFRILCFSVKMRMHLYYSIFKNSVRFIYFLHWTIEPNTEAIK